MIKTRLTARFNLTHPIVLAPMAKAGGGALAAAVSRAGGLGLIGGGYCEPDWISEQFDLAGEAEIGCGFITWRLAQEAGLLEAVLERKPRAIFLSFGDVAPFVDVIKAHGVPLICQVQTMADMQAAVQCGADVIVAQGAEAGGHGQARSTMTFVPEVADWLAVNAPDVLLLAAGGIADGRGLAASLMLGADGVLIGTRFWASDEALVPPNHHDAAIAATGDDTVQTKVVDIVRGFEWPERFNIRVMRNRFTDRWQGDYEGLRKDTAAHAAWLEAIVSGDVDIASATVGQGIGMISSAEPAGEIIGNMVTEAEALLRRATLCLEE